jgi:hypothetical protein
MPPPVAVLLGYGGWIRQPVRTGIGETNPSPANLGEARTSCVNQDNTPPPLVNSYRWTGRLQTSPMGLEGSDNPYHARDD